MAALKTKYETVSFEQVCRDDQTERWVCRFRASRETIGFCYFNLMPKEWHFKPWTNSDLHTTIQNLRDISNFMKQLSRQSARKGKI